MCFGGEIEGRNHLAPPLMKGGKGLDSPYSWFVSPFSTKEVLKEGKPFLIFSTPRPD